MIEHPLEVEGFWIRVCCILWWSPTRGSATKPANIWAKSTAVSPQKCRLLFDYLLKQNIADVQVDNDTYTVTSRRMVRDEHIRKVRSIAGSLGGNPNVKGNAKTESLVKQNGEELDESLVKQKPTPSSSSSSSTTKNKAKKPAAEFILPDWIPPETWDAYLLVRDKKRAARTPYAYNLVIKELLKIKKEYGQDPLTVLNKSITNGWTDVYPLKDGSGGSTRTTPHNDPNTQCPNCKKIVLKTDIVNGKCFTCDPGEKNNARLHGLFDQQNPPS